MSRLPQISGRELVKILQKDGWLFVGQRGSHAKLIKPLQPFGQRTVIIPLHKVLKKGTLSGILKDASFSLDKLRG